MELSAVVVTIAAVPHEVVTGFGCQFTEQLEV